MMDLSSDDLRDFLKSVEEAEGPSTIDKVIYGSLSSILQILGRRGEVRIGSLRF
jgi:hypothetical protein